METAAEEETEQVADQTGRKELGQGVRYIDHVVLYLFGKFLYLPQGSG